MTVDYAFCLFFSESWRTTWGTMNPRVTCQCFYKLCCPGTPKSSGTKVCQLSTRFGVVRRKHWAVAVDSVHALSLAVSTVTSYSPEHFLGQMHYSSSSTLVIPKPRAELLWEERHRVKIKLNRSFSSKGNGEFLLWDPPAISPSVFTHTHFKSPVLIVRCAQWHDSTKPEWFRFIDWLLMSSFLANIIWYRNKTSAELWQG